MVMNSKKEIWMYEGHSKSNASYLFPWKVEQIKGGK
jgi:hypothetical protein